MCQKCDTGMFSGIFAKMNPKCECKCNGKNMPTSQDTRADWEGTKLIPVLICTECKHKIPL